MIQPHDSDVLRDLAFIFEMAGGRTADPQIQHKLLSIARHLRAALRLLAEVDDLKGKRDDTVNAHTLTLKFHRFLSQAEWQKVAKAVDLFVPFVQEMNANAVTESAEDLARVRIEPSSTRAPSLASDPQDPRYKHILSGDYYEPGKKEGT